LLHEARHEGAPARTAYRNPEDVARILARSFFREMTKAGFESAQIVGAASELIDQLHHQLQHEKKSKPEQK
jgi:L-methionine (R)-S-oxide reductase